MCLAYPGIMFPDPERKPEQIHIVSERISRYLSSHPNALDSIEGIHRWWLLKQQMEEASAVVQAAIDYLVSCGEVEQIESNGRTLYASARRHQRDDSDNVLTETS